MNILSLFDGISCARVALERAGIPVEVYYASEIDKYAKQISAKNYPDIIQIGSVVGLDTAQFKDIDILCGGSPCQDLSIAKKDRRGLDGERSGLFWEYARILKEVKPKYFILENVNSMPKEAKQLITETLGVEPIMINAALVSAQNRKRLFWTNIPNVVLPEDSGILLKDVLEDNVDEKYEVKGVASRTYPRTPNGEPRVKQIEIRKDEKANSMTSVQGDSMVMENTIIRKLTPIECERLQSLPDTYTEGISNSQRYKCLGNAFNVDVVAHILSFIPKQ